MKMIKFLHYILGSFISKTLFDVLKNGKIVVIWRMLPENEKFQNVA